MRGPEKQAIVVRDQGGNLVEKVEELRLINPFLYRLLPGIGSGLDVDLVPGETGG